MTFHPELLQCASPRVAYFENYPWTIAFLTFLDLPMEFLLQPPSSPGCLTCSFGLPLQFHSPSHDTLPLSTPGWSPGRLHPQWVPHHTQLGPSSDRECQTQHVSPQVSPWRIHLTNGTESPGLKVARSDLSLSVTHLSARGSGQPLLPPLAPASVSVFCEPWGDHHGFLPWTVSRPVHSPCMATTAIFWNTSCAMPYQTPHVS